MHIQSALRQAIGAALGTAILAGVAMAQGDGVHFFSNLDQYGAYADIWGYRHSSGREIAILGTANGTSFVEVTNPSAPSELHFQNRTPSTWADHRTYQDHAYVVTEGGGGLQVFDLSNLDNIQMVLQTTAFFNTAHNVAVDTTAGVLYAPGADTGMPILSLSSPASPSLLTTYTTNYVHDCHAQNGLVHLGEIYVGNYQLGDATNLPTFTLRDSISTPGTFTHNAWPTPDDSIGVSTDEVTGGHLGIYDISNVNNIQLLGEYTENPSAIIHNALVDGDTVHISYYTEGYVAVDISDPAAPKKIGQYDTYPGPSGGFNGAWGAYPYLPSGLILISDIQTGLYCVAPAPRIQHTPLSDTLDTAGPYQVLATITAPTVTGGVQSADLYYSTDNGQTYTPVTMSPTANPDEYEGFISGQAAGSCVHYYLSADDTVGGSTEPRNLQTMPAAVFRVGPVTTHYFNDFEAGGDQGWTHQLVQGQDDWQRGAPAGTSGDPGSAFAGSNVWGNDIGQSGFNGAYQNNVENNLQSPNIDLTGVKGARLRVARWLTVEDSVADKASIEVNGVEVWSNPSNGSDLHLQDSQWVLLDLDISAQADGNSSTQVRFVLDTNGVNAYGGWTLDDFEIYSIDGCENATKYGVGSVGSGGFTPDITASGGFPALGNSSYQLNVAQTLGGASGFMFFGFGPDTFAFQGVTLLVDLTPSFLFYFATAGGAGGVPGAGTVVFPAPIPNNPLALGATLYAQFIIIDGGASEGLAASDGITFTICDC